MADIHGDCDEQNEVNPKDLKYLQAIIEEKNQLGPNMEIARRLLQEEFDKANAGRNKVEHRYVDVYHGRGAKVVSRVSVPTKDHPKFNFVGKLLGPKGSTLKRLQEETKCKMSVLGKGSIKDKAKEEELRNSQDPKYAHLTEDLHVEVVAFAPPAEAHARVAYALAELRKYLIPDSNDDIAAQQYREMEDYFEQDDDEYGAPMNNQNDGGYRPPPAPRGRGAGGMGAPGRGARLSGPGNAPFGGGERPSPPVQRGGFAGGNRGRGAPRGGRGGAPPARRLMGDNSFYDNGANNRHDNVPNQNRGFNAGGNDFVNTDFQRRGGQDEGQGAWKQRGGMSRFVDRSVPYSRRT